jgi:superfamily II RNA helicase
MTLTDQLPGANDPDALYEAFSAWADGQGLSLYPHQQEALIEVVSGSNVILSTPTGSGKSLVAAGAHFAALAAGVRTFYTAPIKALVSEKFFALCETFGADKVGMLTGDASVNESAWTSSTSTPSRTAAGPGRCRCWSCRGRSSC